MGGHISPTWASWKCRCQVSPAQETVHIQTEAWARPQQVTWTPGPPTLSGPNGKDSLVYL